MPVVLRLNEKVTEFTVEAESIVTGIITGWQSENE
jgi:hypothetical protein